MCCVPLCMLEAVEGRLCLLELFEVFDVFEMFEVPEVIRFVLLCMLNVLEAMSCVPLCMLEAVEGKLCLLELFALQACRREDLELWKRAAGLLLFVGISSFRSSSSWGKSLAVCVTRFASAAIAFAADPSREQGHPH